MTKLGDIEIWKQEHKREGKGSKSIEKYDEVERNIV